MIDIPFPGNKNYSYIIWNTSTEPLLRPNTKIFRYRQMTPIVHLFIFSSRYINSNRYLNVSSTYTRVTFAKLLFLIFTKFLTVSLLWNMITYSFYSSFYVQENLFKVLVWLRSFNLLSSKLWNFLIPTLLSFTTSQMCILVFII